MRSAAALCLVGCTIVAGCGGSSGSGEPEPQTLESLWRAPGDDVAIVPGAADFSPGTVRLSFLVVDGKGRLVTRPTARMWVAHGLEEEPFAEGTARAERIGAGEVEPGEPTEIFVTRLRLPEPGTYWVLAEPVGGRKIQAVGTVQVKADAAAPDVGEAAPPSRTPTLETATLDELSTSKEPDPELYRSSIADALAAKDPFVVVFATPKYCSSRTCGSVADVVSEVRRRHEGEGIRFIHVEIFEGNDPTKGENEWVREWGLPSEPWTFLVGPDGRIRARFEGTVSVRELDRAVRAELVR